MKRPQNLVMDSCISKMNIRSHAGENTKIVISWHRDCSAEIVIERRKSIRMLGVFWATYEAEAAVRSDQGCFFLTKNRLKLANFLSSKDQKSSKKLSFCDIWLNAIIHESLKFFKKWGFFGCFGEQIPRCAKPSLWRRSPAGESPSNSSPKDTFPEKSRIFVDNCAPRNVPKM